MGESGRARTVAAAAVAAVSLAAWPLFAEWWISLLKGAALAASGGAPAFGPPTASPTLAAALVGIALLPLPAVYRLRYGALTAAAALAAEFLVVVMGAALHLPGEVMPVLGGIAQDIVPVAGLLLALSRSEWGRR